MADLANEEKPAIAPPVFVFQKDKAQKRSADGSSPEDGEDSDREDGAYCPPIKRERTSSLTQFPPSQSVTKNNVFMPSSFGNSDSEPEEKGVGFRLKPPTLIHGQAPSTGGPEGAEPGSRAQMAQNGMKTAIMELAGKGNDNGNVRFGEALTPGVLRNDCGGEMNENELPTTSPDQKKLTSAMIQTDIKDWLQVSYSINFKDNVVEPAPMNDAYKKTSESSEDHPLLPSDSSAATPFDVVIDLTSGTSSEGFSTDVMDIKVLPNTGTNGVNKQPDTTEPVSPPLLNNTITSEVVSDASNEGEHVNKGKEVSTKEDEQQPFIFGQNLRDRVKLNSEETALASLSGENTDASATTNYFLQYVNISSDDSSNSTEVPGNKFVFGQNMSERVLSPPKLSETNSDNGRENATGGSSSEPSSHEATPDKSNSTTESLAESAAAYTKATARQCLLEKVEVITGEESESNVLQIQCKLFVFDKTSQSWVERGRGLLRLNDMASTEDGTLQSRLVLRALGSIRLLLHLDAWAEMTQLDKAKSMQTVRLTNSDAEEVGVKLFLKGASSKDTGQLYAALHHRVLALRSRVEQEQETKAATDELEVAKYHEEDSDEDEVVPSGSSGNDPGEAEQEQTAEST
ncbi:ran-binding protein 3 [Protopterus annectens]|uniref:ran-binding protein 3 n=1 Tax=Protopterus annectens TaxID=7888 RepID=UPI001CFC2D6F|nr:ran-binding protein 3 [Protopterus annectens]